MSLTLNLSPAGHLFPDASPEAEPKLSAGAVSRLSEAFGATAARGLELLAGEFLHESLPPTLVFWRELARRYFTRLCHSPHLENLSNLTVSALSDEELAVLVEGAPPMKGLEYLNVGVVARLWNEREEHVRSQIRGASGGVQAYLRAQNPVWNAVGRVTFHLAENKRNPEYPFAFLATYTHRVSEQGKVQHLPLGRALQEYAGAQNRSALTTLLSPVQRAAEKSKLARELLDSRAIFHPQAWPPAQAYRFLKEIPLFEQSGVMVRIPDWWKAGRPPRPQVNIRIGERGSSLLGQDSLLDFKVEMTLDGQPLTEEEWQAILNATQGLVLLKGKWVEVDSEKLKEVLSHWKKVQAETGADGVNAVLALAIPKSIGALWWNATHGDNYSLKASGNAFYADGGAGSNLSRAGQRFWTLSHAKVGSSLPVKYVPGTAVAVTLSVTPGSGVTTFTVEEQPPTGWTVSALNESGLWTAISGKIKWGPFLGSTARTLTYQVTPPSGTSGTVQFSGSADFDGVAVAITGQRQSTNEGGFGQ